MSIDITQPPSPPVTPATEAPLENPRPGPGDAKSKTPVTDLIAQLKQKRVERVENQGKSLETLTAEGKIAEKFKPSPKKDKPEAKEAAEKPEKKEESAKAEPAAERGPDGKFLPKDGKASTIETKAEPAKAPEPKAAKADLAVEAKIEEVSEKLEDKDVTVPDQKAGETDKQYELRLSRLLLETKQLKSELAEEKKKSAKATEYESLRERLKDGVDEDAYEKLTGRSLVETVKALAAKDKPLPYKAKSTLPPEMQEALDEIRSFKKEQQEAKEAKAREEQEAKHKTLRTQELATVKSYLSGKVDAFPNLSAMPNAEEILLDEFYGTWKKRGNDARFKPDVEEIAERLEKAAAGHYSTVFSSEKALAAALKNPETRAAVEKLLGVTAQVATPVATPEKKDPPRNLTNRATQESVAVKDRPLTEEEERAAMHERFRQFQKLRRGQ